MREVVLDIGEARPGGLACDLANDPPPDQLFETLDRLVLAST